MNFKKKIKLFYYDRYLSAVISVVPVQHMQIVFFPAVHCNPGVGGWIILGWILERWDEVMWTGLV
jgi:hypothetical protein